MKVTSSAARTPRFCCKYSGMSCNSNREPGGANPHAGHPDIIVFTIMTSLPLQAWRPVLLPMPGFVAPAPADRVCETKTDPQPQRRRGLSQQHRSSCLEPNVADRLYRGTT